MRVIFTLFLFWAALAAPAAAQEALVNVKIYTNPPGVYFRVDGQAFQGAVAFTWPVGSKHILEAVTVQENALLNTRVSFVSWVTAGEVQMVPKTPTIVVTADPSMSFFRADFGVEYALDLRFFRCADDMGSCASVGTVYARGTPYTEDARVWVRAGEVLVLHASPNAGFVFAGWSGPYGSNVQGSMNTFTMTGPTTCTAHFQVARKIQIFTSPPGLQLLIDRTTLGTPVELDWAIGTTHTLAPVTPQFDNSGGSWVFKSWSDGGAATHAYTVQSTSAPDVLTANFVPAARITFLTSPPGLKLRIDGRDNWYGSYSFSWGTGEVHHAEAPAEQTDAHGRTFVFKGWSNGGPAAQDVVVGEAEVASGVRLTAVYEVLGRLAVDTSIPGLSVTVDGAECLAPCVLDRPAGTEVRLSVPASVPQGDDSRQVFLSWNDGAAAERAFTFTSDIARLNAAYRLENRLVATADPPEGARWLCEPQSPDGFYDAKSRVSVRVDPRPGFKFRRMEGDMASAFSSGEVTMAVPRYVRAVLDRVPYIDPAGVRNAAAETPVRAVAPGSVVAIVGAHLAAASETGPESPLAQTLAGVAVRMGDRFLPLFAVSPELITAMLPAGLEPGPASLSVKRDGQPEVRADFEVVRNAPGLFQKSTDEGSFAIATHPDGSAVSAASPARRGEIVTLYGTGFGPCDRTPPEGFAVPISPLYTLVDTVEILSGETVLAPQWAGAATGQVGVQAVRLAIGPELPSGNAKVTLRVNGQESNAVLLAVE
jgi:uncharacterized protein (TIGR03437 family)